MLDISLLGCGGSLPTPNRSLTSLMVSYNGRKLLIDCGEGTQVSMKILGTGFKSIDAILFTHSHADHVAGIPGLLLTIANSGRIDPITIIGPTGFKTILDGLRVLCPVLPYDINMIEASNNSIFDVNNITISTLSLDHTVPCLAYSLEVKRNPKFDMEKALSNNVPKNLWSSLQKGTTINQGTTIYTPDMVLGDQRKGLKLSYCTDTRPIETLIDFVFNSNLFICEGMYGDDNDLEKALKNKHMLFSEAATLASKAKVAELWLTHFSPSLTEPEIYLDTAKNIFNNTFLGEDRMTKSLNF